MATEIPPRRPPQVRILMTFGLKVRNRLNKVTGTATLMNRENNSSGMMMALAIRYCLFNVRAVVAFLGSLDCPGELAEPELPGF